MDVSASHNPLPFITFPATPYTLLDLAPKFWKLIANFGSQAEKHVDCPMPSDYPAKWSNKSYQC